MKLPAAFYRRSDVVGIARELIGMVLSTRLPLTGDGGLPVLVRARITETEAYAAPDDQASHAHANRRTARTEVMFADGGIAYVYLCYGLHHLFNVVTGPAGLPHAILVRSVEPLTGTCHMLVRRRMRRVSSRLTTGPGCVSQAMGITTTCSGESLLGRRIWISAAAQPLACEHVATAERIGVDYAGEHAKRPWRFFVRDSDWVSRG